jgi:hypothetical protein
MLLNVVFEDLFVVSVPTLEQVNHHDDSLEDQLSKLTVLVS